MKSMRLRSMTSGRLLPSVRSLMKALNCLSE